MSVELEIEDDRTDHHIIEYFERAIATLNALQNGAQDGCHNFSNTMHEIDPPGGADTFEELVAAALEKTPSLEAFSQTWNFIKTGHKFLALCETVLSPSETPQRQATHSTAMPSTVTGVVAAGLGRIGSRVNAGIFRLQHERALAQEFRAEIKGWYLRREGAANDPQWFNEAQARLRSNTAFAMDRAFTPALGLFRNVDRLLGGALSNRRAGPRRNDFAIAIEEQVFREYAQRNVSVTFYASGAPEMVSGFNATQLSIIYGRPFSPAIHSGRDLFLHWHVRCESVGLGSGSSPYYR